MVAPASAAVPGLQTGVPACTWGQDGLVPSALACAQPCERLEKQQMNGLTQRLAMDAGGGQGRAHSPFLLHSHLLLPAQAMCPDPILSIKWTSARFSEAPFSFGTQGARSPIQCVSLCVFCLNTVLPTPYCQHG